MHRQLGVCTLAVWAILIWACPVAGWSGGVRQSTPNLPKTLGLENEEAFFKNLQANFDSWVFEDTRRSTEILRKYNRAQSRFRQYLYQAFRGHDRERQIRALSLTGLLRLPDFAEASLALAQREPGDDTLQEGVAFYLHRIGRDATKNLDRMLAGLQRLLERPSDDWVIFWLGFVDTPEPARSVLQRLEEKADGAAGELVHDALEWLKFRCPADLTPPCCKNDPWL